MHRLIFKMVRSDQKLCKQSKTGCLPTATNKNESYVIKNVG